jgi:uncharacterized protein YjeT (DUF2065 family)
MQWKYLLKNALRGAGMAVFVVGLTCLPGPPVTNPEATTSLFPWLAASGLLVRYGIAAMLIGALLFGSSFLVRCD